MNYDKIREIIEDCVIMCELTKRHTDAQKNELIQDLITEIQTQHNRDLARAKFCDVCNSKMMYETEDKVLMCPDCFDTRDGNYT